MMIYTSTIMPYRLVFEDMPNKEWVIIDYLITSLFWLDLFINMLTTFTEDGEIVKERRIVLKHYLKSWFLIDFLTCFPFEEIVEISTSVNMINMYVIKIVKLTKIKKMYKIFKVTKMAKIYTILENKIFFQFNNGVIKVIKLFLNTFFTVHFMACIWYYQAKLHNFNDDTWVSRRGLDGEDNRTKYL